MSSCTTAHSARPSLPLPLAISVVLALAVVYTVIDLLQPPQPLYALLACVPGSLSAVVLAASGFTAGDRYLRVAAISRRGLLALAAVFVLLLPILDSSTGRIGWRWLPGVIYAPASGIAQELYFRSSLLPALARAFGAAKTLALFVHAAIFVCFHLRTFASLPSVPIAVLVAAVLFAGGCGWGWQVQKDRTVLWAMGQHTAFLMLMSLFEW